MTLQAIIDPAKIDYSNPWAVTAFLVAVLIGALYVLWREWAKEREYGRNLSEQTVLLLNKVEDKLPSMTEVRDKLNVVSKTNEQTVDAIRSLTSEIEGLKSAIKKHYGEDK